MTIRFPLFAAIILTLSAGQSLASDQMYDKAKKMISPEAQAPKERAVINFANMHGRINDWRADGSKAIYIQDSGKKWYRAEFMNNCSQLPFADSIGFITDGTNEIDRFSSIIVRGERCWFKSFAASEAPVAKSKTKTMMEGVKDSATDKAKDMAKDKAEDMVKEKAMDSLKDRMP